MRIAIPTRYAHAVGGVETYLECVLPLLAGAGHDVKVWNEFDTVAGGRSVVPAGVPIGRLGPSSGAVEHGLADIAAWKPDVVFSQGIAAVDAERRLQATAPMVVLLHAYHGACISGNKMHAFPAPAPCSRELGPGCLLRYHVRRCGGWSPVTMVASYREQRLRQTILREANAVAVLSDHMRRECIVQGVDAVHVRQLPVFVPGRQDRVAGHAACGAHEGVHIIFVGRMERLKGAHVLLSALEQVAPAMLREVRVTIVGDGRERQRCEQQATRLVAGGLRIEFTGWLSHERCAELVRTADLLAVPSVWPEPLGLVGLEASAAGVAAVAFDVGGVREWLTDNVTGRIVPGAPSETGLARALEDCLRDWERLRRWGAAAADRVRPRTVAAHVNALEELLSAAAGIVFHRNRVVETGTYA